LAQSFVTTKKFAGYLPQAGAKICNYKKIRLELPAKGAKFCGDIKRALSARRVKIIRASRLESQAAFFLAGSCRQIKY
jgi:hypothetical protein